MRLWLGVSGIALGLLWCAWIAPDTPAQAAGDRKVWQVVGAAVLIVTSCVLIIVDWMRRK